MRRIALFLLLILAPPIVWSMAKDPHPKQLSTQGPKNAILTDAFASQFDPRRLENLGNDPSLDRLLREMSPKQRKGARTHLNRLEAKTSDPEVLEEISKGYKLLGKHRDMLRVGGTIQQLKPDSSRGFSISAHASTELGEYEEAVAQAKAALKRNPNDKVAWVALKLSEGRVSISNPISRPMLERREETSLTEPPMRSLTEAPAKISDIRISAPPSPGKPPSLGSDIKPALNLLGTSAQGRKILSFWPKTG